MQNKKTYTDFIITELNKGKVKYNDVCLLFCTKFDLTKQTFNKFWKQANAIYSEQRETINKEILSTSIAVEKEAIKTLILDKTKRMQIAEEIALGKAKKVEGTIVMPTFADRMKALDYLSKIEGDYAPKELEITNNDNTFKLEIINANTTTPS